MRKKSVFLRLWSYLTRYKATLFLAIFLKVLSSFMSVLEPFILGLAITELTANLVDMAKGSFWGRIERSLYCWYFDYLFFQRCFL